MMVKVQVWAHRAVRGWDGDYSDPVDEHPQIELSEALRATYTSDAHFVPYVVAEAGETGEVLEAAPRVNKRALSVVEEDGGCLRFGCIVLDVDAPKAVRGDGDDAVEAWYLSQIAALDEAKGLHVDKATFYRTRGGFRLVWPLEHPIGPAEYEQLGVAWRQRVRTSTGGAVDPDELKDWTRCYRLPYVVRDGERQTHELYESSSGPLAAAVVAHALSEANGKRTESERKANGSGSKLDGLGAAKKRRQPGDMIPQGSRNQALASIAGSLRASGLSENEVEAALTVANEERCDPPLEESEIATIARSISRYPAPPVVKVVGEPRTTREGEEWDLDLGSENEVADVVLGMFERHRVGAESLIGDQGLLWEYGPEAGIWSELPEGYLLDELQRLDGASYGKRAKLRVSRALSRNVYQLCQLKRHKVGFFEKAPAGIAFRNGVVLIDDGEAVLVPHSPEHRLTHTLPFDWDPGSRAPIFEAVLDRCFDGCDDAGERADLILEFAGASLLGVATRYQRALLLIGEGANGKSTILDVVSALFPDRSRACIPPQMMGDDYHRAELAGVLLNVVTEVPESDVVHAESFRAFVDGSEMTARRIREAPFRFRPRAGHLMAANNYPGATDHSHAYWRRWIAVHFPNIIPESEQEEGLAWRIIREELPGVAVMVIEAAAALLGRGPKGRYTMPSSSVAALKEWRLESDKVASYVEERLMQSDEHLIAGSALYSDFVAWCKRNGYKPMGNNSLAKRLKRLNFEKGKGRDRYSWWAEFKKRPTTKLRIV